MLQYNKLKQKPREFLAATGLTDEEFADEFLNRLIARVRIIVENVICEIKRCRIVKDQLRLSKENISDLVMEIACGLHNLRVTFRQARQRIEITSPEEFSYFK